MNIRTTLLGAGLAALLATAAFAQQSDTHHPAEEQKAQEQKTQEQTAPGAGQTMNQGMGQNMMGRMMMGQGMPGMGMMNMMGQGGMMGQRTAGNPMSGMMANMSEMMSHMSQMMKGMEAGGMASGMAPGAMNIGQPKGDQGPASQAFAKANADMHAGMDIEYSGNVEVDFVKGMIPHHQGAVAMAKILLENGKDPELRKLAEDIVAAQEKEIAFMNEWLKKQAN